MSVEYSQFKQSDQLPVILACRHVANGIPS